MRGFAGIMKQCFAVALGLSVGACIPSTAERSSAPAPAARPAPAPAPAPTVKAPPRRAVVQESPKSTWQARPVTADPVTVAGGEYVVEAGDTLRSIGNSTGAGSEAIAAANNLEAPYILRPGQSLRIPGGSYHVVSEGQTGIAIARAYGVPWSDMVALNELDEPYILRIGQRLRISASSEPTRTARDMSMEERARAFDIGIDEVVTGSQPAIAEGQSAAVASSGKRAVPLNAALAEPVGFNGRFVWPLRGKLLSSFGSKGGGKVNDGINIGAARGAAVRASASGVVAYAGNEIDVYGGLVLINHGDKWVTAYGHLDRLNVVRGEKVTAGQQIGTVGETGYVTEPQLHFEIRNDRRPVNPTTKLPAS